MRATSFTATALLISLGCASGSGGAAGTGGTAGSAMGGGTSGRGGTSGQAGNDGTPGGAGGTDSAPADASAGDSDALIVDAASDQAVPASPSGACGQMLGGGAPASQWVYFGPDGHLAYKAIDPQGDRIMDFSSAGYLGGGVPLPVVPMAMTLKPSGADDSMAIQAALDAVAQRPITNGFRGAVVLAAGTFNVSSSLSIAASGVVLRGSGSGTGGTTITMTGDPHAFLTMHGAGSWIADGATTTVADDFVPAGSRSLSVASAAAFKVGDTVLVKRPVTDAWIHFMGMDLLVRNGAPQTWLSNTTLIPADRVITAIDGNKLTFDVPLPDSYDAKYVRPPGATVGKYTFAGRIEQVGVEHLRVTAPVRTVAISMALFTLMSVSAVKDGWLDDVVALETENSVKFDPTSKRFTARGLVIQRSTPADSTAGYPLEVTLNGSQILVVGGSMKGDDLYTYATVSRATGPNVVLNATATGVHTRLEPHERWATGFLADNVVHDDQLNLVNRLTAGSGHGWAIGWGVLWNSTAATLNVQAPPGSMNWAIGCKGKTTGDGTFESTGTPVAPKSLYLAQLCDRLGPQAMAAVTATADK